MNVIIISIVLAIWVLVLSVVVFWQSRFLNSLVKGTDQKDLVKVLKKIIESTDVNAKDIERLRKEAVRLTDESRSFVQRIGLVRFNPFHETGGDHSFSLAVLDATNTGFIITGLHARDRTRIYMKNIVQGKSEIELSKEEIKAFNKAQKALS